MFIMNHNKSVARKSDSPAAINSGFPATHSTLTT